jgi:hypothetical protein
MSYQFSAKIGFILIGAEISGPSGTAGALLVLDTGAITTALSASVLRAVGYDPDAATDFARMTSGTAVTMVPRLVVNRCSGGRDGNRRTLILSR